MNTLAEDLRPRLVGRVVVVGVGNRLRGDDAAGPAVIDRLTGQVPVPLVDAGEVPENHLGPIAAARPELVLIVDAVDAGGAPGDVVLIEEDEFGLSAFSTHNPSMVPFATFLRAETGTRLLAIGIQPQGLEFDAPLHPEVEASIERVADLLKRLLGSTSA